MKRNLPLILLLIGLIIFGGVYFFIRGKAGKNNLEEDETALIEVSLEDRPITLLIPSEDGHWLKMRIEKLKIEAKSMDYELLYQFPDPDTGDSKTAGVPGSIILDGIEEIERDLLMGSESSGKYRYDEGVTGGTLTLRFRNDKGQLLTKFVSDFNIYVNEKELASGDGKFSYTLKNIPRGVYFVAMDTFGVGEIEKAAIREDNYAIFASSDIKLD